MAAQLDDGCLYLGNRRKAQVGLLQAHPAGLQQQHGAGRDAVAVVFDGQLQRTGNLGPPHFAHAAALEGAFDGGDDRVAATEQALGDDHAVVGLGHDALARQPRRHQPLERA
ncbi:hypothetical protein D3C79_872350 [compost metagenome]